MCSSDLYIKVNSKYNICLVFEVTVYLFGYMVCGCVVDNCLRDQINVYSYFEYHS